MASRNAKREDQVIRGTGNVFEDLGYSDATERQAKLRLAYLASQVCAGAKAQPRVRTTVASVTQRLIQ